MKQHISTGLLKWVHSPDQSLITTQMELLGRKMQREDIISKYIQMILYRDMWRIIEENNEENYEHWMNV